MHETYILTMQSQRPCILSWCCSAKVYRMGSTHLHLQRDSLLIGPVANPCTLTAQATVRWIINNIWALNNM